MTDSQQPIPEMDETEGLVAPEDIRSTSRSCLVIILLMLLVVLMLCVVYIVRPGMV